MKKLQKRTLAGRIVLSAAVFLASAGLAGCGEKVTAERLIEEMAAKSEEVSSVKGSYNADMSMEIGQMGVTMNMDMAMRMDIETTKDPQEMHADIAVDLGMMGLNVEMETYMMEEEGGLATYLLMGDQWLKSSSENGTVDAAAEDRNFVIDLDLFENASDLTLQEETEQTDKGEVYVLNTTFSADDIDMELFDEAMESMGGADLFGIDLSGMNLDVTLKIYKDSCLPASILMKSQEGSEPFSMEFEGVTGTLSALSYEMIFDEYNTIEKIELPAEARNALDMDSFYEDYYDYSEDYGDYGGFTLPEDGVDMEELETLFEDYEL